MKNLFSFFTVCTILIVFNGCTDDPVDIDPVDIDPCSGITCVNGDCVNGSCDCDQGWEGPYCSEQTTPTSIEITSITITQFPGTADAGAGWADGFGDDSNSYDLSYAKALMTEVLSSSTPGNK